MGGCDASLMPREVQDCGHGRTRNACFEVGKYLILFWNQASEANVAGNAERDVI
jgi:hypothetical protein